VWNGIWHTAAAANEWTAPNLSVGIHPWYIPTHWQHELHALRQWIGVHRERVFAIGEAGLDSVRGADMLTQLAVFEAQIALSEAEKLPLIIHCVRAHEPLLLLRKRHKPQQAWIFHGFMLKASVAQSLLDAGIYLSFGAALLKPNSAAQAALALAPAHQFFLETDDASVQIADIYAAAAAIRGVSVADIAQQIQLNYDTIQPHRSR
jgi:TatD DNase family protein